MPRPGRDVRRDGAAGRLEVRSRLIDASRPRHAAVARLWRCRPGGAGYRKTVTTRRRRLRFSEAHWRPSDGGSATCLVPACYPLCRPHRDKGCDHLGFLPWEGASSSDETCPSAAFCLATMMPLLVTRRPGLLSMQSGGKNGNERGCAGRVKAWPHPQTGTPQRSFRGSIARTDSSCTLARHAGRHYAVDLDSWAPPSSGG
jgi:hypothetical protein